MNNKQLEKREQQNNKQNQREKQGATIVIGDGTLRACMAGSTIKTSV